MLNGGIIKGSFNANGAIPQDFFRQCAITDIFLGNQTANTITGFKIGTTPGGAEVYTAPATITAFQFIKEINPNSMFDFANDKVFYVSATNWNGGSIGLGIKFENLSPA